MRIVVLSGGAGSRLWPISRRAYPKQLLALADSKQTMLQQTLLRARDYEQVKAPAIIVCNDEHRFMVAEQCRQIEVGAADIILEPAGRNTAPAIALAAQRMLDSCGDDVMLVMPADHLIQDLSGFTKSLSIANAMAQEGKVVTFGVVPGHPETGYGYIQAGSAIGTSGAFEVSAFKEKPSEEIARRYLQSGNYYWNSGIFVVKASVLLDQLRQHAPEVLSATSAAMQDLSIDLDFLRPNEREFERSPNISIDYAVMEDTEDACVVPLDVGWDDIGAWSALHDIAEKDENNNSCSGDVLAVDSSNSYLRSEDKLLAAVGLDNIIAVQTADAVLVANRDKAQDVKKVVEILDSEDRSQISHHRKVYRPWGWYDSLEVGANFQVKRILVNPGAKLSVQMHHHRAEHWVVIKGEAEVQNGEAVFRLQENQSTYIPALTKHSLSNPSALHSLEIIEVQTGSYLGEDDIVRFDDIYGRSKG